MKVYVHYNDFTAVYRDCEDATIQELLRWIVWKYNDKHGDKKLRVQGARAQRGGSGRPLDKSDIVRKVLQDRADVYIICEAIEHPADCTSNAPPAAGANDSSGTGGIAVPAEGVLQSPAAAAANNPLESAPVVQNLIRTAHGAEESKNFRQASTIYEQLLGILPAHTETFKSCLEKMSRLWLTVDRPLDALPWARKAARAFPNDAGILELLGDCLSHPKAAKSKLPEALTSYTAATEAAIAAGLKDSLTRLILAKARVLNRMDDQESKARAASLIMEIVSADQSDWQGLYHYAQVAADRGMMADAIRVLLRLLVERPNHSGVRRALAEVVSRPGGLNVMLEELTGDAHTDAALAFLATCIKDYGAVDAAISLFRRAASINNSSTAYVLNLIHTLELNQEFVECIGIVVSFCENFEGMSTTMSLPLTGIQNKLSEIGSYDDVLKWFSNDQSNFVIADPLLHESTPSKVLYNSDQLDALAVFMTAVKIVFLGGALACAGQVVRMLEPAIRNSEKPLHTTLIRNEAAYFGCIQQILQGTDSPKPMPVVATSRPLFLAGDSHCLSAAWQTVELRGETRLLVPQLVTGCKIWHIREESVFYPKVSFRNTMNSLPDNAQVVMLFGEIDCREGLLLAVEKCKYDSLEEGIDATLEIYLETMKQLLGRGMEIFIHPIPPVLNETRHIVLPFNAVLKEKVLACAAEFPGRLHWLDFLEELLTPDKKNLKESLAFDGTHLPPSYIQYMASELAAI